MEDFSTWREDVRWDRPLNSAVVCLMLRICACVVPYLGSDVQWKIEADLEIPIQSLADQCHQAAVELSDQIPISKAGLLQVQQLLLTSYWYSGEGNFSDCWHALGTAIRAAQEIGLFILPGICLRPFSMLTIAATLIGLNTESKSDGLGELDRDLRRRTWCILDIWDWYCCRLFVTTAISDPFTGRFLLYSLVRSISTATTVILSRQTSAWKLLHLQYTR